nr:hypothetical protein [Tanacetum cinerariifolium]
MKTNNTPFSKSGERTVRPESSEGNSEVLMIDFLSIVETIKVNHTIEIDIVILVVETESSGMSDDKSDKKIGSSDGLQPKQADLSFVHALNKPHLHEIHVILRTHEANQFGYFRKTVNSVLKEKLPIRFSKKNCQFGYQRETANMVNTEKLRIQLTQKTANSDTEETTNYDTTETANPDATENYKFGYN